MTCLRQSLVFMLVYCTGRQCILGQTVTKLIKDEGYPSEEHTVTTKDGYVLIVHRITGPRGKSPPPNNATKPVVLLQHGFAASSDCWVLSGRKSALGFLLADRGYDVWLANSRGSFYSNHMTLNLTKRADKKKFDKFSFHEKGTIDLPATMDYILNNTGAKNLALYAHSEGASMFFALGAVAPTQLKKINSFYGFAPLVFVGNITSPIAKIASIINRFYLGGIMHKIATPLLSKAISILSFVTSNIITRQYAAIPIEFVSGGSGQIRGPTAEKIYKYFPNYVSPKSLFHVLQMVWSSKFGRYNHAIWNPKGIFHIFRKNYNLKKIETPMYLYFSPNDAFINDNNLKRFKATFIRKNVPKMFRVNIKFGHYDFVYGKDAPSVYALTYDTLKNHTSV